jgi:hypothetical protein
MSNETVVTDGRTVPGASPGCSRMDRRKVVSDRWVTITPFGRPVDPEV